MAPAQCPRQVLIWTLPALAVLISLFWYKRKKSLRSDPGGTTLEKSSERVDSHSLNLSCVSSVDSDKVIAAIEKAKRDIETSQAIEEIVSVEGEEEEIVVKASKVVKNKADFENSVQEVLEIKKDNLVDLTLSPISGKEISEPILFSTPIKTDYQDTTISSDSVLVIDEEKPLTDDSAIVSDDTIIISSTDSSFDEKERPVDEETIVEISSDSLNSTLPVESSPDKKDSKSMVNIVASNSDSPVIELVDEHQDPFNKPVEEETCVRSVASNVVNAVESPAKTNRINKVSGSKKRSNKKTLKDSSKTNKIDLKDNKKEDNLKEKKVVLNGDCKREEKSNISSTNSDKVKETKMELSCSRVEQLGHNSSSTINGNEAGLEQKLATLGLESSHNSEGGERDSANHSPAEIMLASPSMSNFSDAHSEGSSDSGKGCSDIPDISTPPPQTPAGGSSVAGDLIPSIYEFIIPQYMVGRLIGRHGVFLHDIRSKTHTHIFIKRHPDTTKLKICAIEGAQQDIDAALAMIRQKFPLRRFPNLTLEKVTFINVLPSWPLPQEQFQLQLIEGLNNDVILSSLISAGHFFLQQPMHPSYQSLSQLNMVMNSVYNSPEAPALETPLKDAVCAAPAMGGWYRAQIIDVDEDVKSVDVRFLDYGGFLRLEASTLRKIRGDLMMLPFQAVECLLANVIPAGGEEAEWTEEARLFVQNLTCGQILQAHISEYTETGIPLVYLYAMYGGQVVVVNDELVSRGFAETAPTPPPPVSSEE